MGRRAGEAVGVVGVEALRELRAMRGGWELGKFREGTVVVAASAGGVLLGHGDSL
ncbi:hypothetical protein [Streptomyces sp. 3214.6]|uniref:hypothetical protein n=1 Tax=Streptomyces sp. 3214.6 TaxID=1882757 RepID=UPI0013520E3E|nr:hypothetical protein [Streptomyces sp. 3214.6]